MAYIASLSDPTEGMNNFYAKRISFEWELCDADGCPWTCDIHYDIDERTNHVDSYGVRFHFGAGRGGLLGIKEVLQEIVEDLEGKCVFMQEPTIE
jgi:hypothetical protein